MFESNWKSQGRHKLPLADARSKIVKFVISLESENPLEPCELDEGPVSTLECHHSTHSCIDCTQHVFHFQHVPPLGVDHPPYRTYRGLTSFPAMDDPITADFPSRVAVEEEEERAQATAEALLEPPTIEVLFLPPMLPLSATSPPCIMQLVVTVLGHTS